MPGGQPPIFATPEELQGRITQYLKEDIPIKTIIVGKPPKTHTVEIPVPTISGLSYYLGFASRQSFYDYEKRPEFSYTIKRARLFIEQHYEELLQGNNIAGAIFALKNFGWSDKQEIEHSGDVKYTVRMNINGDRDRLREAVDAPLPNTDN